MVEVSLFPCLNCQNCDFIEKGYGQNIFAQGFASACYSAFGSWGRLQQFSRNEVADLQSYGFFQGPAW